MSLILLALNEFGTYSERRLVAEAKAVGSSAQPVLIKDIEREVHSQLDSGNRDLTVLARVSGTYVGGFLPLLSRVEELGVRVVNSTRSLSISSNKAETVSKLAANGIPVPPSTLIAERAEIEATLEEIAFPVILKLPSSSKGLGTVIAESRRSARSVLDLLLTNNMPVLVQEFVASSCGEDLRCFVLGSRVAATMRRRARVAEEFRSNCFLGGVGEKVSCPPDLESLAVRAAHAVGAEIAGIDFLFDGQKYQAIEINGSPGFEELERVTERNIARQVVEFAAQAR